MFSKGNKESEGAAIFAPQTNYVHIGKFDVPFLDFRFRNSLEGITAALHNARRRFEASVVVWQR